MRWLVTGSAGFTGRHLARKLREQGHEVLGLGLAADETVQCDLADACALQSAVRSIRPERVVHLAAVSFVAHANPADFESTNVTGTVNLLTACASLDAPPAVALASSAAVYGRAAGSLGEASPVLPVNDYGRSKLAMERHASRWADRVPLIITRPFNYTGPGQGAKFLVPKIVDAFKHRRSVLNLGNQDVARDFSDVRDVAEDYMLLLGATPARGVVNLCSGRAISILEILSICERLTGFRPEIRTDPALVRPDEIPMLRGDPARLISLVGRAHRLTFEQTLADMLAG